MIAKIQQGWRYSTPAFFGMLLLLLPSPGLKADASSHAEEDALLAEAARLAPVVQAVELNFNAVSPSQYITMGNWSAVIPWTPHVPVTCAQLPDGRILTFASNQRSTFPEGPEFTYAATWDYRTGEFLEINNTRHDMFCGGVALLKDGRVIVNGGRNVTVLSSVFDWRTDTWSALPNMQDGRWYNTSVALPDGSVFTASGSGGSDTAERWQELTGWTRLTNINWALAHGEGGLESIWHPFLHVAPDGRVAHTGPTDSMHWVNPTGNGQFTDTGVDVPGDYYPKDGVLVMYDIGKIVFGGGRDLVGGASNLSYTVDINGSVPVVTRTGDVNHARTFANSVVLPTGEVMMIGGNTSQQKFSDVGSVLTPEIWNPQTGTWRDVADASVPRNYHSLAVLLPDGRVWSGGGGLGGNSADHPDAQIYTPGVLFKADGTDAVRPVITSAPASIGPGLAFSVQATPGMQKFSFIKLASLTHSVGSDLRFLSLPFTEVTAGNYTVQSNGNSNIMTPGYWMLFAVSPTGPYSVSKIIQVTTENAPVVVDPGSQSTRINQPASLQIIATGPGTLTYSATGLPTGLNINAGTGLITGTPSVAGVFSVTVGVASSLGPVTSQQFSWVIAPETAGLGSILREWWTGISGNRITNLTGNAAFPNSPSGSDKPTSFEAPTNWADNYGQRMRGWIHAPFTGQYHFWVAGDDETQLKLSSDDTPGNAVVIAGVPSWTPSREWAWYGEQASSSITLQAGQRYYIEAIMKESGGGDNLAVAWEFPGSASGPVLIDGSYLSPWTDNQPANTPPVITMPASRTNVVGDVVALQINATDADGNALTYSATGLPAGLSINGTNGLITGVPTTAGIYSSVVSVTDGRSTPVSATLSWTVKALLALQPLSGAPAPVNTAITFTANSIGGLNPQYQWNFGDGSPATAFSAYSTASKTYTAPGRYLVTLTAKDSTGREVSTSFRQAVHAVLTTAQPTVSSSIAYQVRSGTNARLWVVNPDQDSVVVFDAVTRVRSGIIPVGAAPRTVAIASDGSAWVVNSQSATISIIGTNLALAQTVTLPRGSRPFAVVFDPAGANAYVSLQDTGTVLKISSTAPATVIGTAVVGSDVRHLSVSADGGKVFATRFITPKLPGENTAAVVTEQGATKFGGQVAVISASTMVVAKTIILEHSNDTDSSLAGRGIPNYLGPAVISPDGTTAWVPSKKDNIKRGTLRDGQPLTHDSAVRSITSRIDLSAEAEDFAARIDFNDAGIPSTAAYEPSGIYLFAALEGSREVAIVDSMGRRELLRFNAGRAPQGVVTSPDGRTLFVHNFMDRTVTVHDVSAVVTGSDTAPTLTATLACITTEKLAATVLKGKQLFYDSQDERLALQQYISCAACHNDGDHDGRVWDFTGFGEGLRNNISLKGHGTHGPSHWSGNFDEIQDFEGQIRNFAGGLGLIAAGAPHPPLGTSNAGRSADLDALAAYVTSLTTTGDSPNRTSGGALTADAAAGQTLFKAQNCAACHSGSRFTNSALNVFADIGTLKPASGKRLDAPLTGLDVPTLRGTWNTAPYLHDGSADTLADAIRAHQGLSLTSVEVDQLAAFVSQIDDQVASAPAPINIVLATASTTVNGIFSVTGVLSEAATGFTVSDISITGGTISGFAINGTNFGFNVTPTSANIQISIAAGTMTDSLGIANIASNTLAVATSSDVTRPAITLTTATTTVSSAFSVNISASETIGGLTLGDFVVTNGVASGLTGSGASYGVTITPTTAGLVTVALPAGTTFDLATNASLASNTLSVTYSPVVVVQTIRIEAENFDEGGEGVAYHDTEVENFGLSGSGFFYRAGGVDIEPSEDTDGTPSVGWTQPGEWLSYTTSLSPGSYDLRLRAATNPAGPFSVRMLINGTLAATFNVTNTGGWNTWRTFSLSGVNVAASGQAVIRLEFPDGMVNLNWFELTNSNGTPDTTKPTVQLATSSASVSVPFDVNVTFSEPVTGVALDDFTITNGTLSNLTGSGAVYSVRVSPLITGPVSVGMRASAAIDAAGNTSTASNALSVDYAAPVVPVPTVVLSTVSNATTGPFVVTATFSKSVAGLLASEFTVTNGTVSALSAAGSVWSATVVPTASGLVSVTLPANVAQDTSGAGNLASNTVTVSYTPILGSSGLTADYYIGKNFEQFSLTRVDPKIDFSWSGSPGASLPADVFSVRWHGSVIPRYTELYSFTTKSDDGVRLWINGQLLVNNWTNHGETWNTGVIALQAGVPVSIIMEFYEDRGGALARLVWESSSQVSEIIPQSQYLVDGNTVGSTPPLSTVTLTSIGAETTTLQNVNSTTDTDGDEVPDLLEQALGTAIDSGITLPGEGLKLVVRDQNSIDATLLRPAGQSGITLTLESTEDLTNWMSIAVSPSYVSQGNGWERVTWSNLHAATGQRLDRGMIRLRVTQSGGETVTSSPVGWELAALRSGTQTFGLNLSDTPIFTGSITRSDASGITFAEQAALPSVIDPTLTYYLEVVSGPVAGHRLDLQSISSTECVIATDSVNNTLSAGTVDLSDARVVLRAHRTLGGVFDPAVFKGTTNFASADHVAFYADSGYQTYWLYSKGGQRYWVLKGDATLAARDDRVIPPGTGVMLQIAAVNPAPIIATGSVRTTPFARPLVTGYNLVANPWPMDASPGSAGLTSAAFTSAATTAAADQLQLWKGDAIASGNGYSGYWLFQMPGQLSPIWISTSDTSQTSHNNETLLRSGRATFIRAQPRADRPVWVIPAP